jgi:hypothetical protein
MEHPALSRWGAGCGRRERVAAGTLRHPFVVVVVDTPSLPPPEDRPPAEDSARCHPSSWKSSVLDPPFLPSGVPLLPRRTKEAIKATRNGGRRTSGGSPGVGAVPGETGGGCLGVAEGTRRVVDCCCSSCCCCCCCTRGADAERRRGLYWQTVTRLGGGPSSQLSNDERERAGT